jgi:hypothetical protein
MYILLVSVRVYNNSGTVASGNKSLRLVVGNRGLPRKLPETDNKIAKNLMHKCNASLLRTPYNIQTPLRFKL